MEHIENIRKKYFLIYNISCLKLLTIIFNVIFI